MNINVGPDDLDFTRTFILHNSIVTLEGKRDMNNTHKEARFFVKKRMLCITGSSTVTVKYLTLSQFQKLVKYYDSLDTNTREIRITNRLIGV